MESKELREVGTQLEQVADVLVGSDVNASGVDAESVAFASEQIEELVETTDDLERGKRKLKSKVTKRNILIVILVIIIILLLLKDYIFKSLDKEVFVPKFQTGDYVERVYEEPEAAPRVDIPIIMDFAVNDKYPYGTIFNPQSNEGKFHLKYAFTILGEEQAFYTSDFLKAGDKFTIDFYELLPAGEHDVTVNVTPYTADTFEEKSGTMNSFKIKVSK